MKARPAPAPRMAAGSDGGRGVDTGADSGSATDAPSAASSGHAPGAGAGAGEAGAGDGGHVAADWIAVDWGSSHLRGWAMAGGTELAARSSADGISQLDREGMTAALERLTAPWRGEAGMPPVVACGMVGSRQGWAEAAYRAVPCTPTAPEPARARWDGGELMIAPGLKQAAPADVMRGEETQIAGFLRLNRGFDGIACLPGTHSKWAQLSAGEVVSFRTFMTGELFALLSERSVLRLTLAGEGWDGEAFAAGLDDALSRPEALAGRLFGLRAEALLEGLDGGAARARLSGLLIGAELAASRPYWLGQEVVIIGESALAARYAEALDRQGLAAIRADAGAMTRAGLAAARAMWAEAEA